MFWLAIHNFSCSINGVIKFNTSPIPKYASENTTFKDSFNQGDRIWCRFSYAHAVRNYPIPGTMNEYPPLALSKYERTHTLYFQFYLTIDGKKCTREDQPDKNGWAYSMYEGEPEYLGRYKPDENKGSDFYCIAQGQEFLIAGEMGESAQSLMFRLSSLPKGEHKIKVEVRFILDPTYRNMQSDSRSKLHVPPFTKTVPSTKLAEGEFTYISTHPQAFIPNALTDEHSLFLARCIMDYFKSSPEWGCRSPKTEQPVYVAVMGPVQEDVQAQITDVSGHYNSGFRNNMTFNCVIDKKYIVPCKVVFYRDPRTGWDRESVAMFDLTAVTYNPNQNPVKFIGQYVGKSISLAYDDLPDEVKQKIDRFPGGL